MYVLDHHLKFQELHVLDIISVEERVNRNKQIVILDGLLNVVNMVCTIRV